MLRPRDARVKRKIFSFQSSFVDVNASFSSGGRKRVL